MRLCVASVNAPRVGHAPTAVWGASNRRPEPGGQVLFELLVDHPRLALHYLPPYAPDLNAVEGVWSLTKYHRMANHTISELHLLHAEAQRHLQQVGNDQLLLRSCFAGAGLALSLASAQ